MPEAFDYNKTVGLVHRGLQLQKEITEQISVEEKVAEINEFLSKLGICLICQEQFDEIHPEGIFEPALGISNSTDQTYLYSEHSILRPGLEFYLHILRSRQLLALTPKFDNYLQQMEKRQQQDNSSDQENQ